MKDLYDRLGERGFDAHFLKSSVLPDWWEDKLASEPSNRALAEAAVSKLLGFRIQHLRDPKTKLPEAPIANFRLKRDKDVKVADLRPSLYVAERLAKILVPTLLKKLPDFDTSIRPEQIRKRILAKANGVDLESLVAFAWSAGVVVIHVDPQRLPKDSKKFAGVAMFCGQTPVVVLASKKDGPPWLAFHLAHELGHIFLGHVKPGDDPLVDADIDKADDDQQEKQADEFANSVLTGSANPAVTSNYRLNAQKLANAAKAWGQVNGVNAGTVALVYARTRDMWGSAQGALQLLHCASGAHALIGEQLAKRFDPADVSESSARFLSCLTMKCE